MKKLLNFLRNFSRVIQFSMLGLLVFSLQAQAQNSGVKTFVVGFPAGGTTDNIARKIAEQIRLSTGQYIIIDNQGGEMQMVAARAFQNAPNDGSKFLIVRAANASAPESIKAGGMHPLIAGGGLEGLMPVANLGSSAPDENGGYVWMGVFAPPGMSSPVVQSFQATLATALRSEEVKQTLVKAGVVPAHDESTAGYYRMISGLNKFLLESTAESNRSAGVMPAAPQASSPTPSAAPAMVSSNPSSKPDDEAQLGQSDAPLSIEATGKINIMASLNTEKTPYTKVQMPQGLNPTNLNVYNDLPTNMMGMQASNIIDRARFAQTAVDQDRRGGAKRHITSAAAHQCLKLIRQPRQYGGFTNTCNYAVEYNFCLYHPEKDSWGAMFDCEKGNGSGGSWQVGPLKNVAAHTNGAERMHWFACRWGETLGKAEGVSPADVYFDRGSQRMMGCCASWGRETERYASADSSLAKNTASQSQSAQASTQRPTGSNQQSNSGNSNLTSPASPSSSFTSSQSNTGKWPNGVEPGNLYIVKYSINAGAEYYEELMLISARSKAEAEQQYERAYTVYRDERLKPFNDQINLGGGNANAGRANLAFHAPRYKMDYQVTQECLGANWGAVVGVFESRSLNGRGAACGAKTPAEAITAAFEVCSRKGYNCNREGTRNATPIITIAHSGARPWVEPIDKPRVGSSWPPATFQFTALSATTYQMSASVIDYVQGPNEAIASFGKACGKKSWPRDIYSCWLSSRMMPCLMSSPINPQDKMPMQQTCIDQKLTKDGYLP